MKDNATKQMVLDLKDDISVIRDSIKTLSQKVDDLFNHQSSRLPIWATTLITLLASVSTGLIVALLKGG